MPGPGPGSGGPFYFAWANATDIEFSSDFYRYDEAIFDFELTLAEGQMPTLSASIKNPGVGLLSPSRQQWCWFSWFDGERVTPLFFGRLVGIPSGLTDQVIHVQFIARSNDYVARRQALAERLKKPPFYDPAFLEESKRDDPDAILEAYAAAFHVDPITHIWTISDILQGEDGIVVFGPSDVFYDSLKFTVGQPGLTSIRVNATVKWSQVVTGGSVDIGSQVKGPGLLTGSAPGYFSFYSMTGASFISDWPKAGARIGGGWVVQAADAIDMFGIDLATTVTSSNSYTNNEKKHKEGDIMSSEFSETVPLCAAPMDKIQLSHDQVFAIIWDDYAQPTASNKKTFLYVPTWLVVAYLYLEYEADRKRTEQLSFVLNADLQPILADPTAQQDSEVLDKSSVDLGVPLILSTNWTSLAGREIGYGQVTFPNNPKVAGSISYQICVQPGVAGLVEPDFSNVVGAGTVDGTVIWACLGPSIPAVANWNPSTDVSLGTLIAPIYPAWIYYAALLPPVFPYRTTGADIAEGQIIRTDDNKSFQMALIGGVSGFTGNIPAFSPNYGDITNDGGVQWVSLGPILPSGTIQMCISPGQTAIQIPPPFSVNYGQTVADGGVIWISLGYGGPSLSIPVGGVVGNVTARSYFPSDRGHLSIKYLLMLARAKLLTRARAVEVAFEAPFSKGTGLTCRMTAQIVEAPPPGQQPRLPGGQATGKIIKSVLKCDGATGKAVCEVTIGCAIGNGGTPDANTGTPSYATNYFAPNYQAMNGSVIVADTNDIGYSKPVDNPADDGLIFPLVASQVVLKAQLNQDLGAQQANIASNITIGPNQTLAEAYSVAAAAAGSSIYLDLLLKPLTGQQFTTAYALKVTKLKVIQQIDLAAGG